MHKSFTRLGQNHARTRLKAQSRLRLKHGITRHVCKACMVCLNQVKTGVKHGKIQQIPTETWPTWVQKWCSHMRLKWHLLKVTMRGDGPLLLRTLKHHPHHWNPSRFQWWGGPNMIVPELTKIAQNGCQTRPKRGQTTPKLKATLNNHFKEVKTRLLYVIH